MRMIIGCILFSLAAISMTTAQIKDRQTYLKEFEQRARYVRSFYDTASSAGYYQAAARYAEGVNIAQADSMVEVLLQHPRGDMFWMFPVIGTYLHGKDKMSEHTRHHICDLAFLVEIHPQ